MDGAAAVLPYGLAMFVGSRLFAAASEQVFRRAAYAVIAAAALVALPALDSCWAASPAGFARRP